MSQAILDQVLALSLQMHAEESQSERNLDLMLGRSLRTQELESQKELELKRAIRESMGRGLPSQNPDFVDEEKDRGVVISGGEEKDIDVAISGEIYPSGANQCAAQAIALALEMAKKDVIATMLSCCDPSIVKQILRNERVDITVFQMMAFVFGVAFTIYFDLGGSHVYVRSYGVAEGVPTYYIEMSVSGMTLDELRVKWPLNALHFEYRRYDGAERGRPTTRRVQWADRPQWSTPLEWYLKI
jgi:hypothetical protein